MSPWASPALEAAKETKFGTEVVQGMRMMPELRIHAEKVHDTTLDDKELSQHNSVVITFTRGHYIPAKMNACASDLNDTSRVTC